MEINKDEVCARFSRIYWHDSKLIDLHLLKSSQARSYDLELALDLIVSFSLGNVDRSQHRAVFRDCRIIQANLDLLGIAICGGDIAAAVCYTDAVKLESERRQTKQQFDFPDSDNPLKDCLGFVIQMIPPGGEMIIFAKDFQIN